MKSYQTSKKAGKWYHSLPFLALLLVLCIVFLFNIVTLLKKNRETALAKENARRELESVLEREQELEKNIDELESEKGIEKAIREQYQVTKEGEGVIVIVNDEEKKEQKEKTNFFDRFFSGNKD